MPRKSKTLRLQQAKDTLSGYVSAGLRTASQARFLADMISRMERDRYPTKRQRDWLDRIIEEGVPEPKGDLEYIAKIDEALSTDGIDFADVLTDFRGKLVRGWDLSTKQKAWCDKLIATAKEIRDGTHWSPDAEMTERIKIALSCEICYNHTYWMTHSAGAHALKKCAMWVAGSVKVIDSWAVNKLFKTVAGKLRQMENPKFAVGDMGYIKVYTPNSGVVKYPCVILDGPKPLRNGISYDVLVNGEVITDTVNNILKR